MGKLKYIKLPKKPKASASITVKEKYLAKVKEIQSENLRRKKENDRSDTLSKQIAGINGLTVLPSKRAAAPRKKSARKTKPVKKAARRKRK